MPKFKSSLLAACVSLLTVGSAFGALANVQYFDFAGWNPSLIDNGVGQTFTVAPGLNVTVKGVGDFSGPSRYTPAGSIESGHLTPGTNQFSFTFDTTLPIVVQSATVDPDENVDIIAVGPETYHHDSGLAPTLTNILNLNGGVSGLTIQGVGYGPSASAGETTSQAQINLPVLVQHDGLSANKYEYFRIGTPGPPPGNLPEPAYPLPALLVVLLLAVRHRHRG